VKPIEVRPFEPGDEKLWLEIEPCRGDVAGETEALNQLRCTAAAEEPCCLLIAVVSSRCVGRLRGTFLTPTLYFVREIVCREGTDDCVVGKALTAFLSVPFGDNGTEVLSWDKPESRRINTSLELAGFEVNRTKVFVKRDLENYESPYEDPFSYQSLSDLGEERFLDLLSESAVGDPFEDVGSRDPKSDFDDLVSFAGAKFNASWWQAAFLGGDPIGVVLPQAFADSDDQGSLFYVGVRPEFRRRGYGKILHAAGLAFLSSKNIRNYMGSTDTRNEPMKAVFRANGCAQTGTQLFYKAPTPGRAERSDATPRSRW
jgi:RimJ/RimL family protein N-acetyltransferase